MEVAELETQSQRLFSTLVVGLAERRVISRIDSNLELRLFDRVVVRTSRGTETAQVVSVPRAYGHEPVLEEEMRIVRKMTPADTEQAARLLRLQKKEMQFCKDKVAELKLKMSLYEVEHLFGSEKVIVHFSAEGRVDYRELVRILKKEFGIRVEMHQMGARDSARLLGEIGHCGMTLCCKGFLKSFQPVAMKMARIQKQTLQSDKVSGACGRLMCCLRYEQPVYEELNQGIPARGKRVVDQDGKEGVVLSAKIIEQQVQVDFDDGNRWVPADQLALVGKESPGCR